MSKPTYAESEAVRHCNHNIRNGIQHFTKPMLQRVVHRAGSWSLIESYLNGSIRICQHYHASLVPFQPKDSDFVFFCENVMGNDFHRNQGCIGAVDLRIASGHPRTKDMQPSMPINTRPLVQNAEIPINADCKIIWSETVNLVRLYRLDDLQTPVFEWPQHSGGFLRIIRSGRSRDEDRELQLLVIGGGFCPLSKMAAS